MATEIGSPIDEPKIDWRNIELTQARITRWAERMREFAREATGREDEVIGRIVRFQIADGYAEYVVFDTKPLQLVHVPESYNISDAHMRGLTLKDIRALVNFDKRWASLRDEHEEYFASLPIGTIVHYDEGFGKFVRCVRVEGAKGNRLKPIALVGNWSEYDLPRRSADGSVRYSSGGRLMEPGFTFEPNYGSIWERYDADRRAWSMRGLTAEGTAHLNEIGRARFAEQRYQAPFDPTTAEPIDLTLPEPTDEEKAVAVLARKVNLVREAVGEHPREQTVEAYRAMLDTVIAIAQ